MGSDNLLTAEQPWPFRTAFSDAWISDVYTRQSETLTKALQNSYVIDSSVVDAFSAVTAEQIPTNPEIEPIQTPTASGGSDKETVTVPKQRRGAPPSGRITKRKSSRPSKRTNTTFVAVDPENFRQMVQQVTGVKFDGLYGQAPAVLKPEPHREAARGFHYGSILDTSSFFLNGLASYAAPQPPPPFTAVADGGATAAGIDFNPFCSYPTLESWKVM